eukprot:13421719-Alexandrium_andersonii.AAC.1
MKIPPQSVRPQWLACQATRSLVLCQMIIIPGMVGQAMYNSVRASRRSGSGVADRLRPKRGGGGAA